MVVSIYKPTSTQPTNERSMCGWTSVQTAMANVGALRIDLIMAPSSGIGVSQIFVSVPAETNLAFKEQRVKIESDSLTGPIFTQFGQYNRGAYESVGLLKGPIKQSFLVESVEGYRPAKIRVSLPEIEINGQSLQPEPVAFALSQSPAVVGLCQ